MLGHFVLANLIDTPVLFNTQWTFQRASCVVWRPVMRQGASTTEESRERRTYAVEQDLELGLTADVPCQIARQFG